MKTAVITNLFIRNFSGSEMAALDAAKYFRNRGYSVIILSGEKGAPLLSEVPPEIKVIDILKSGVPEIRADILWGAHWAIMTKVLASPGFSAKKIVHISLSPYERMEREPTYAAKLSKLLANSWETAKIRMDENPGLDIEIFNNSVLPDFFTAKSSPGPKLENLAVVGNNKVFARGGRFAKLLKSRGINVQMFGCGHNVKMLTSDDLAGFDAILTIGRTVQYSMALGIPAFNYDRFGGPGYIGLSNWAAAEKMNYSGRVRPADHGNMKSMFVNVHDIAKIADDLESGYAAARADVSELRKIARKRYDLFRNMDAVLTGLPDAEIDLEIMGREYAKEIVAANRALAVQFSDRMNARARKKFRLKNLWKKLGLFGYRKN